MLTLPNKPAILRINRRDPIGRAAAGAWLFNERGGLNAIDLHARRNGTLTNGPTWGAEGILFDGTNDYVAYPSVATGTNYSLYVVAKYATLGANSYQALATKDGNGTPGIYLRGSSSGIGGTWSFYNGGDVHSVSTLTTGAWNHLAVSVQGSTLALYHNGKLDVMSAAGTSFNLERTGNDAGSHAYSGQVACVFLFSRALTALEMKLLWMDPFRFVRPVRLARVAVSSGAININFSATSSASLSADASNAIGGTLTATETAALSSAATVATGASASFTSSSTFAAGGTLGIGATFGTTTANSFSCSVTGSGLPNINCDFSGVCNSTLTASAFAGIGASLATTSRAILSGSLVHGSVDSPSNLNFYETKHAQTRAIAYNNRSTAKAV